MAQDSSAPATKEDVGLLMERMGEMDMKLERKADASEVKIWIQTEGEKTRKYFDLVAENLHYDLVGVYKDRTEDHEQRIRRLEHKTGLAA